VAPTATFAQRRANMEFLRDRMIEAAICGGLDAAWNRKRCGDELSADYLVVRRGGKDWGVDLGRDYDNNGIRLELTWYEKDDPFACYHSYTPRPSCP
jgi:hypothetical protein